jgi:hypothetical protein
VGKNRSERYYCGTHTWKHCIARRIPDLLVLKCRKVALELVDYFVDYEKQTKTTRW